MDPTKLLLRPPRRSGRRAVNRPSSDGIDPRSALDDPDKSSEVRFESRPNSVGTVPVIVFSSFAIDSDVLTVHDDPAAFAEAAAALLLDGDAWRARSDASLRHTRRALSEPGLDVRLLSLLNRLLARRCAQHDEQAATACAWRPRLMRAAWPGLRSFAWEVMGLDDGFLNATELRPACL